MPNRQQDGGTAIDSTEVVKLAADAAATVKPSYLAILDLRSVCTFTDHFLIASANSARQVRAIAERVEEQLARAKVRMSHREGVGEAQWILLDYHNVVVHIFADQTRAFYDLERLWADAPKQQLVG
ncbi:MAG: ribosome silencing factor [candidate division NC10 bacterium]|nr:ribosome silencing factor [candidate division NC10 bacterium]